ncbi:MAG TPA: protein-L-isoaspartate(D-aspartate) O-methyltransferase [Acetobacteraceae bacterium]|nr:protein-L-isoaspartate(D-aspartate) O-methyltransferase [Acetobacteraceae bacterium]
MKPMSDKHFAILRRHMVEMIGIHTDLMSDELGKSAFVPPVLAAMLKVPRHLFVPQPLMQVAYEDAPLPIGFNKTISQPFIAALMSDLLEPEPHETVLEVGTGLGYHAAVLAELANRIYSVEIVEEFAAEAEARLQQMGYSTIEIRVGDGSRGWADHAPYDKIMVTAAADKPPPALLQQLKPGGRMVLPMGGEDAQVLATVRKDASGRLEIQESIPVRFTRLETVI